jgi:hypothetical protein
MKAMWPGRDPFGNVIDGVTHIHVSCDIMERKEKPPYDFKTRVEYRILQLGVSAFEEVFVGGDLSEVTCHCTDLQTPVEQARWSNIYPRPDILVNMAVGDGFFEYLIQQTDLTKWDVRRKGAT